MLCEYCGSTIFDEIQELEKVCEECGYVCEINDIDERVEIVENDTGVNIVGKIVDHGFYSSRQRLIMRMKILVNDLVSKLSLSKSLCGEAINIYLLLLSKMKTKRIELPIIAGVCIYIAARRKKLSLMLMDISDKININIYKLGRVYKRWMSLFNEQGKETNTIDSIVFIERIANQLDLGSKTQLIIQTANKLLKSMRNDYIGLSAKPNTIAAVSVLLASRIHRFDRDYDDIVKAAGVSKLVAKKLLENWSQSKTANFNLSEFKSYSIFDNRQLNTGNLIVEGNEGRYSVVKAQSAKGKEHVKKTKKKHLEGEDLDLTGWSDEDKDEIRYLYTKEESEMIVTLLDKRKPNETDKILDMQKLGSKET